MATTVERHPYMCGFVGSPALNPYVNKMVLNREIIKNAINRLRLLGFYSVSITPKEGTLKEALMKADSSKVSETPPPVSSSLWSKRLDLKISDAKEQAGQSIALGHLINLESKLKDEEFISLMLMKVSVLFSVFDNHFKNNFTPETTKSELTQEQELFAFILKSVVTPPYCIRAQLETRGISKSLLLPQAKFDLVVTRERGENDTDQNDLLLQLDEEESSMSDTESANLLLFNKTNTTIKLKNPNASVVLETLIFSEFCDKDIVPTICASCSFMRPILYVKSKDALLTPTEVNRWCDDRDHRYFFIETCVLFLLFVCSGESVFPNFDEKYLSIIRPLIRPVGWKEAYKDMPDYGKLHQSRPVHQSGNVGASLQGSAYFSEDIFKKEVDEYEEMVRNKRPKIDDSSQN